MSSGSPGEALWSITISPICLRTGIPHHICAMKHCIQSKQTLASKPLPVTGIQRLHGNVGQRLDGGPENRWLILVKHEGAERVATRRHHQKGPSECRILVHPYLSGHLLE